MKRLIEANYNVHTQYEVDLPEGREIVDAHIKWDNADNNAYAELDDGSRLPLTKIVDTEDTLVDALKWPTSLLIQDKNEEWQEV